MNKIVLCTVVLLRVHAQNCHDLRPRYVSEADAAFSMSVNVAVRLSAQKLLIRN